MRVSLSCLFAFVSLASSGVTAERYLVTCGNDNGGNGNTGNNVNNGNRNGNSGNGKNNGNGNGKNSGANSNGDTNEVACSKATLASLEEAGATVLENYPFGVAVIESETNLDGLLSGATISFDLEVQLEQTESVAANFTGFSPSGSSGTNKSGDNRRRLTENPPLSGDDDFFFDLQWGNAAVRAVDAWNAGVTGAGVRVCVLDEGFDMSHPDLVANINQELSIDFTGDNGPERRPDYLADTIFSHGTHVAGTIGAANNGYGTIGVAPDSELVLIKVISELLGGAGAISWILAGLYYAGDIGCDVINMSLGVLLDRRNPPPGFPASAQEYKKSVANIRLAMKKAVKYASQSGATIIAASGNDGINYQGDKGSVLRAFADFQDVLPVNACGPVGWIFGDPVSPDYYQPTVYSSNGQESEFCAPGGQVDRSFANARDICSYPPYLEAPCWYFDRVFSTGAFGDYYWSVGTSMASPHAAGVAALIISEDPLKYKGKPAAVRSEMRRRAVDKGKPGRDDAFGFGFVQW